MIVELHWRIYVNSLYNMVKLALMIFINWGCFILSLLGVIFTWFISLPPNSVYTFADLEQNFHDYFFIGETELKLSHLTSVKQKTHENISEYIRRFRDTRNWWHSLTISDRDLADLAFAGLLNFYKAKLDAQEFLDFSQILHKPLANESWAKEARDSQKYNKKSLIVLFMCLGAIPIVWKMKVNMFMLLSLFGLLMISPAFVVLLTRFTKIGKKDSLLMYPNARVYLMNYIKMDTLRCRMSYRHLKN